MVNMTKSDLRTGMFGVCKGNGEDRNDIFVVVGDRLIFQDGLCDYLDDITEDLCFPGNCAKITELYEAACFKQVEDGNAKVIWTRPKEDVKEATEKECDIDAINITFDQFVNAVEAANKKWMEASDNIAPHIEGMNFMMGLQNITFGGLIARELFGESVKVKEDK